MDKVDKEKLKGFFDKVFSTDEGKVVLRHIQENICNFHKSSLVKDNYGGIDVQNMCVHEGKRAVWLKMKELIKKETLKEIEKL